jgi:hypothetical protein
MQGCVWLFRELVGGTKYSGEVIQTERGTRRVHLFRAHPADWRSRAIVTASGHLASEDRSTIEIPGLEEPEPEYSMAEFGPFTAIPEETGDAGNESDLERARR